MNHSLFTIRIPENFMTTRQSSQVSARKQPKQARSNELVAAILEAAVQVLAKEGAHRFTTARVAERAGVSVGSLYQYFPNKAAILFRLQSDEWRQTTDLLRSILEEAQKPPLERLRILVHAFIRSECDEAEMRVALGDAAPLYRDANRGAGGVGMGRRHRRSLHAGGAPDCLGLQARPSGQLNLDDASARRASSFRETPHSREEIEAHADAMADMFCTYLASLEAVSKAA